MPPLRALDWKLPYFCDAEYHITFETVNRFLDSCDFYTIDVADLSVRQHRQPTSITL